MQREMRSDPFEGGQVAMRGHGGMMGFDGMMQKMEQRMEQHHQMANQMMS